MKRVPFNTTLDEDLLREVRAVAEQEGRDVNWYIEHLFQEYLSLRKKRKSDGVSTLGFPAGLAPL